MFEFIKRAGWFWVGCMLGYIVVGVIMLIIGWWSLRGYHHG